MNTSNAHTSDLDQSGSAPPAPARNNGGEHEWVEIAMLFTSSDPEKGLQRNDGSDTDM